MKTRLWIQWITIITVAGLGFLGGCSQESSPQGKVTALAIHSGSLPAHRHLDAVDTLKRHFLAAQSPGDRLILLMGTEAPDEQPLLDLQLPTRPLAATRSLRAVHRNSDAAPAWSELELAPTLHALSEPLRDSPRQAACLYLAVNPERLRPPQNDQAPWHRLTGQPGGWTAHLLLPEPTATPRERRAAWIAYLHHIGAGRIQVHALSDPFPPCR